jgi:hypothetical protein
MVPPPTGAAAAVPVPGGAVVRSTRATGSLLAFTWMTALAVPLIRETGDGAGR